MRGLAYTSVLFLAVAAAGCAAAVEGGEEEPVEGEKDAGVVTRDSARLPSPDLASQQDSKTVDTARADAGVEVGPADGPVAADTAVSGSDGRPAADATAPGDVLGPDAMVAPGPDDYLKKVVPVLLINVGGKTIPWDMKISGTIKVVEDHDGTLTGITTRPTTLSAPIGIEVRGSSSRNYAQTPFGLEIRDTTGQGIEVPLLGLPKEADFVLHSCYADKTCLRNAVTYAIGQEIGRRGGYYWAPRTRWVEVYRDDSYRGLYLLVEKLKRDGNRVALPAPAADATKGDITGGYLFSAEGTETYRIQKLFPDAINSGRYWQYRSPNHLTITSAQKTYLQGAIAAMQKRIAATPRWAEAKKVLDAQTFIDFRIMQEVANNVDGYFKSYYLYKQTDAAGGRFFAGPLWDFDIGWGNANYYGGYCPNIRNVSTGRDPEPFFTLVKDPEFRNAAHCRYNELRKAGGPLDVAWIEAKIDAFAKHIATAKDRDQKKWANIGKYTWPNNYVGSSWTDEIRYLKYWIRRRLDWLDKNFYGTCPSVPAGVAPAAGTVPAPARESVARTPICCGGASVYIPVEGPAPAGHESFACN